MLNQLLDERIRCAILLSAGCTLRLGVEETLNKLLEAEADELCGAGRYERSPDRIDTRAGSYKRNL